MECDGDRHQEAACCEDCGISLAEDDHYYSAVNGEEFDSFDPAVYGKVAAETDLIAHLDAELTEAEERAETTFAAYQLALARLDAACWQREAAKALAENHRLNA